MYRRQKFRLKNNTKIALAVITIATLIIAPSYYFAANHKGHSSEKIISINDSWTGEAYSGFRDLAAVNGKKYMISTSHEMASMAGLEVLKKGGNAIDAVIASQMVLNVVEPQSSGIGGGAFLLYYNAKTKETHYYNGRETAPKDANGKIFLDENGKAREFHDVVRGGLSVGTPGLLKLLKAVHEKYGKLPWEELFDSAIKISSVGFPMDNRITVITDNLHYLKESDPLAKFYYDENGKSKPIGELIKNPELSNTLKIIAKEGIDSFYSGKIADDIIATVKNSKINPGYLSKQDLQDYQLKEGDLICGVYRVKYKVCSMPLPSSGGVTVLQILGILENFNLAKIKPSSLEAVHLISEATRLAYADRNKYIADVANVPIAEMLNKNYLKERSALINLKQAMPKVEAGIFVDSDKLGYVIFDKDERPSTTNISVIDEEGNAIVMTSSIEYLFGSGLMVDGFVLNNQLTDFSFVPEIDGKLVANRLEPGKQPRSSMSPTFIFDNDSGKLLMVVGSPGGPRIIQYVVKTIIAHLDWNMDIQKAISLPNHVVLNDIIELENRTSLTEFQEELIKMGHNVKVADITSGISAITISDKGLSGGADPRRSGIAAGF